MAHEAQFYSAGMQDAVNILVELFETELFINLTVKQLMEGKNIKSNLSFISIENLLYFLGYTDALIETASKIKPGVLKDNKFGILQAVN